MGRVIEETVKVLFHLIDGFTKVFLERTKGIGMANFGIDWDRPTRDIPVHLRQIGSRFMLRSNDNGYEVFELDGNQ